jgi:hypothetical protein
LQEEDLLAQRREQLMAEDCYWVAVFDFTTVLVFKLPCRRRSYLRSAASSS